MIHKTVGIKRLYSDYSDRSDYTGCHFNYASSFDQLIILKPPLSGPT